MSATLVVNAAPSGGQKAYETVTVTAAGHVATTTYNLVVSHPHGGTSNLPFVTDGAGAATIKFVPSVAGNTTATSTLSVPATVATVSFNVGGQP